MAGARRRIYSPTSPLIAREDLRFSGRPVATRAVVPEEYFFSARQRRVQWDVGKVDHEEDLPPKKLAPPAPTVLPTVTVQPAISLLGFTGLGVIELPAGPMSDDAKATIAGAVHADGETVVTFPGVATQALHDDIAARETESLAEQVAKTSPVVHVASHKPFKRR